MKEEFVRRPIRNLVLNVNSWNPIRDGNNQLIRYIDLSAVDQDRKTIKLNEPIFAGEAPSRARQLVEKGDVLVSTVRPNLNGVGMIDVGLDGATASTGFCVLRPNRNELDGSYLFHWVKTPEFISNMTRQATGASYPAVSDRIILDSTIPLPPIDEQRRIAMILDQADALRRLRRQALEQLDTLTQSIFLEMFGDPVTNPKGWDIVTIRDLLESASYGTSQKAGEEGELPILRMNNITYSGEINLTDLKFITLKPDDKERYIVCKGDILFNRTNSADLVGKSAVYRFSKRMAYAGYLVRLRANSDNHSEFIGAFLNSAYAKKILRGMCKSIIGMANINANEVQEISIPKPPLPLQQEFARRVEAIEQLKATHRESLAQLDSLFASLQHRAFRGEL